MGNHQKRWLRALGSNKIHVLGWVEVCIGVGTGRGIRDLLGLGNVPSVDSYRCGVLQSITGSLAVFQGNLDDLGHLVC